MGSGIEVYHSTGLEPYRHAHEFDHAAHKLTPSQESVSIEKELGYLKYVQEEQEAAQLKEKKQHTRRRRLWITIGSIVLLAVISIVVGVGVGITKSKKSEFVPSNYLS